jgi:sterol desaturase/sphingolipid hydroxylase (fatty acid hydroxylase superfamily)
MDSILSYLLTLVGPWPSVFAFDFGRYLVAAAIVTGVIAAMPRPFLDLRRVRLRRPEAKQQRREFRHSVSTALVFSIVGVGIYYGAELGMFRVYSEATEYGWFYWIVSLALIVVAHDGYFYWIHRWMHRPSVFRRIHRTHHLSVAPTQWAAYSFSIGEALAQAAFLPVYLLIVPTHELVLFLWMAHQVLRNVVGHCGIELVPRAWLATWWGRWITTTLHHDMHHEHGRHNYGLYFTWWDRWCGTEHPEYRRRLKELIATLQQAPGAQAHGEEA